MNLIAAARTVIFALLSAVFITAPATAQDKAKHVLIVVMDGLRRDSVTEADMPTLHKLASHGVFFDAHHPMFLSSTEVNGTALATGMYPAHSGVMANKEYRPDVELLVPIETRNQWAQWKSEREGGQPWIVAATIPELARAAGMRTAVAGSKGVAIMWDRGWKNRTVDNATVFEGQAIPSAVLDQVMPDYGPFPPNPDWKYVTNTRRDQWTTSVLIDKLWAERAGGVPPLSVLWLSEPDFSQHGTGPGSEQSKAALKSSDDQLARALAKLDAKGLRDRTNIVVVSDHGFSTISRWVNVPDLLRKARFKAESTFKKNPEPGSIMCVGQGGSMSFYVVGRDEAVRAKLVAFLQASDFAGVLFTKEGGNGTFKLADAGLDTPSAPDVLMAFKWKDETWKPGRMVGTLVTDGMDPGQGMHGSLSRYDMRNTLIMAGPNIKNGVVNKKPSGNMDVAPTVAHLLGIKADKPMDGRILKEALAEGDAGNDEAPMTESLTAQQGTWQQYLKVTTYQGRRYYDEGNRGVAPR